MKQHCDPKDMIKFLLALCCQDGSSTTPISHNDLLDTCFNDCWNKVIRVANSEELRHKLDI